MTSDGAFPELLETAAKSRAESVRATREAVPGQHLAALNHLADRSTRELARLPAFINSL